MLRSYLCAHSDASIVVKWTIELLAAAGNKNYKAEKMFCLKIMRHIDHLFKKLTVHC